MSDYIDRERLKEAFNADLQTLQTVDKHTMNLILMEIDEVPAANVAPVVHAAWDDSLDGITPFCTACGCTHRCLIRKPLHCPNCGAKMDKEDTK